MCWPNHRCSARVILCGGRWVGGWLDMVISLHRNFSSFSPNQPLGKKPTSSRRPGLKRWQHHAADFPHQTSVILRSPWSRPPSVSSLMVLSVGTWHLFQSAWQDTVAVRIAQSLKNPSKGLTFLSFPWRKYSEFFRNCNTACRDAKLTWHHWVSEA